MRRRSFIFGGWLSFLLLAALILPSGAAAQPLTVEWLISPSLSPYFNDWEINPAFVQLQLTNPTQQTVRTLVEVKLLGRVRGPVASSPSKPLDVPPGIQIYRARDVIDFGNLQIDPSVRALALQTGRIPDDDYQFCVALIDPDSRRSLIAGLACSTPVSILSAPGPQLISPSDGDSVGVFPLFQWTPTMSVRQGSIRYHIRISEVIRSQLPSQALAANLPYHEADVLTGTSYLYPLSARPLEEGKLYAWMVQAFDPVANVTVGSDEGKSQIWTFRVKGVPVAQPPLFLELLVDLGGTEVQDAIDLSQNSQVKKELKNILGKFARVNEALGKKDPATALKWKEEALKELNELLGKAKRLGESDNFIKKLQEARKKLEAEIAKEKGAVVAPAPGGVDLGGTEVQDAIDLSQNSQVKKELKNILEKFDHVNEALGKKDGKTALMWKDEALKELNELLGKAKHLGESDDFIKKVQEARKKLEAEIKKEGG